MLDEQLIYSLMKSPMQRVRCKICGITRADVATDVAAAGADAIGLVFYQKSPRNIANLQVAADICKAVGPFVSATGLFVNAERGFIRQVLEEVPLSLLQFHGDEAAQFCESFGRPYIKALRMKPGADIVAQIREYPSAIGILLDAYRPGVPGGTGEVFDWQRVPQTSTPIVLAGGLTPDNVSEAVQTVKPWAVDVSGGVESSPGEKSMLKVKQFLSNINKPI